MQFIDLQAQRHQIAKEIDNAIANVFEHGHFINGPEVKDLGEKLAGHVDANHCIPCGNGTDALQIALMALNIGPGDLVFVPAFSFFATAEVVSLVGATVAFVDICDKTYNLCPIALESALLNHAKNPKGRPAAVIAVDLFGQSADYTAIKDICNRYDLKLIEDAAQSFGATFHGRACCNFGDIATTSFFPAKPLGCYGDGGAVFCNDAELASMVRSIANHGQGEHKYDNVRIGMNSRLDTVQAAILIEKLKLFPQEIANREMVAKTYTEALEGAYVTPFQAEHSRSVWAQYSLLPINHSREEIINKLKQAGIPTAIYYPRALPDLPAMSEEITYSAENARKLSQNIFSIPMHPWLNSDNQQRIIEELRNAVS